MESNEMAKILCDTLAGKKAEDIIKINVTEKTVIADYFIIASANSTTQVRALCEYCEQAIEKAGGKVRSREGLQEGRWAVVDFGDCILHIFNDETRLFYNIERLWSNSANTEKIEG